MSDQEKSHYEWATRVSKAAEKLPRPEPSDIQDRGGFRFHAVGMFEAEGGPYMTWMLAAPAGWWTGVTFGRWKV